MTAGEPHRDPARRTMEPRAAPRERWILWHACALAVVCGLVYFIGLSWRSFASSEGHRVQPALEMLARGDWWRITLFEQTYLRKPPGMPWAIAAMSSLFGPGEFAARSVSALSTTLAALAAWWFGSRWFGARYGIAAGLALALMPQLWSPGRSAEIESLNNFGTLLACLAIIDRVLARSAAAAATVTPTAVSPRARADGDIAGHITPALTGGLEHAPKPPRLPRILDTGCIIALGALGLVIAVLAKGPAGAPVVGGTLLAALAMRRLTRLAAAEILLMAVLGAAVLIPLWRAFSAANRDPGAIVQGAEEFLWSGGLAKAVMLVPIAMFSALPASLGLMFPFGPDARLEAAAGGGRAAERLDAARLAGLAYLFSLGLMLVIGLHNPRYALPAAGLLAPITCYVYAGAWGVGATFEDKRRKIVKRLMLGNPLAPAVVLCTVAVLSTVGGRRIKLGVDGREAGAVLARIAGSSDSARPLWADDLIEARPDVLMYARMHESAGLRPLWKKAELLRGELPPAGSLLVLRTDAQSTEVSRYEQPILAGSLVALGDGKVGGYAFRVYRRIVEP